jgi:hypothetical protein
MASQPGQDRRRQPLATDVADHRYPILRVDLEQVVEVAAHQPLRLRRPVPHPVFQPGHLWECRGEQAALQRLRDIITLAIQPRVVECHRDTVGELLDDADVLAAVLHALDHPRTCQGAQRAAMQRERGEDHRARVRLTQERQVMIV